LPVARMFDLIAGTSTGGILAVGMAQPGPDGLPRYTAADMRDLYLREGAAIFPKPAVWSPATRPFAEKYSAAGIENILRRYFGDARLKDSLCNLLVTSYEIGLRQPWFFRSDRARKDAAYDFALWEVARATSAAPTYFPPARLARPGSADPWMLIDGGTFANNPALCAFAEIRQLDPDADVLLVSLGTGRHAEPIHYRPGLLGWAKPILDIVFDGVSRTAEYQLEQLLPALPGQRKYYRFQIDLTAGEDALDNTDPGNLQHLCRRAEGYVSQQRAVLQQLCAQLTG
jgi:predicted acylesterase/phospholipase RssA